MTFLYLNVIETDNKITNENQTLLRRKILNHEYNTQSESVSHKPVAYHFEQWELQAQLDIQTAKKMQKKKHQISK
jgi:hypothetical protein